jgi:NlpC/P60 family/Bacterial dipeptidyl-peptidase Sh3 domain
MSDRRLTPANGRVAHVTLRGKVDADTFVEGEAASVVVPVTDILAAPGGARDRQLLMGDAVMVLERRAGHAFLQSAKDGYCGYVSEDALGPAITPTHWVAVPASHLYPVADMKRQETAALSFGACLRIVSETDRFFQTAAGFVPRPHLRPLAETFTDPAEVAMMFLGTPYLWGGNSRSGIDCSGLVQAALLASGIACPGDSDMQQVLGQPVTGIGALRRNDLLFWNGHVALALDESRMIHANAFRMAATVEGIAEGVTRIAAQGDGEPTALRRVL